MSKYKVGYTCGVFDLFHVGHLNLLEKCKSMCDYLIVGICDDDYVINEKNKQPIINQFDRARIINALKVVDEVKIIDEAVTNDKLLAHSIFQFDVLFSGDDWKGSDRYNKTEKDFRNINVSIEYLPYTQGVSTTSIVRSMNKNYKKD